MDDLSLMSLSKFRLWSIHALKVYLSCRNRSVNGDFDELAARAFCVWEENLPVNEGAELNEQRLLAEYKAKLVLHGDVIPDPFSLSSGWKTEKDGMSHWPSVYITDISSYLGCSTTNEIMVKLLNEYKLGKAYRYFDSNWVKEVHYHEIREKSDKCILKTKVTPSQAVNNKCYDVWAIISKDVNDRAGGSILSAYCTCTAGMFGCCNHVAGLLFRVEKAVKTGETKKSCTSRKSEWNVPTGKIQVNRPIKAIDCVWSKGRYDRSDKVKAEQIRNKELKASFTPMSKQQAEHLKDKTRMRNELYSLLKEDLPTSRFVLTMEKSRIKPAPRPKLPPTVMDVAKEMGPNYSKDSVIDKLKLSCDERDAIKNETVQQALSQTWKDQRKGRITASNFQRVSSRVNTLRKNPDADPSALVETILGQRECRQSVAMKHGVALEPVAKKQYHALMRKTHTKFHSADSGLAVDLENPFLAASADLEVECVCCGQGLCEIKCPESIKDQAPSVENVKYLELENGVVGLDKSHTYFYQIQGQMKILGRAYCDLFIFTLHGDLSVRIAFDKEFWVAVEEQLVWFWGQHVLPAMLCEDAESDKVQEIAPGKENSDKSARKVMLPVATEAQTNDNPNKTARRVLMPVATEAQTNDNPNKTARRVLMPVATEAQTNDNPNKTARRVLMPVATEAQTNDNPNKTARRVLLPVATKAKTKRSQPPKKRRALQKAPVYLCGSCGHDCLDNPENEDDQSVGCDKCGVWVHYSCAGVDDDKLKSIDNWFCKKCE